MTHRLGPDRAGVSNVLGAILLFGIFIMTLVTIQVEFVPRWEEDREARHMDQVADQLAQFTSDLNRMAANQTRTAITDPLTLQPSGGFRFLQAGSGLPNELAFDPPVAGQGVNVTSPQLRILARDGEEFFGLNETWEAIVSGDTVDNVTQVRHLRIRVDMIPGDYNDGDSATLSAFDRNGIFAGKAVVTFRDFPSEQALAIQVFNRQNQEISSGIEAFFQQTVVDYFYIDLLDGELLFDQVLAAAESPIDLTLARNGLDAAYTIVYNTIGAGGPTTVGNAGILVPNYSSTLASGSLAVEAENQHFPPQTFVIEHGAVILEQAEGTVMRVPPAFRVTGGATQVQLIWTMPGLTGDRQSLGGSEAASLIATPAGGQAHTEAFAARVALRIPTGHPAAWSAWLDDQFRLAGLASAVGQYSLSSGADFVLLTVYGPVSDPNSTTEDVYLNFQQAPIRIEARASR